MEDNRMIKFVDSVQEIAQRLKCTAREVQSAADSLATVLRDIVKGTMLDGRPYPQDEELLNWIPAGFYADVEELLSLEQKYMRQYVNDVRRDQRARGEDQAALFAVKSTALRESDNPHIVRFREIFGIDAMSEAMKTKELVMSVTINPDPKLIDDPRKLVQQWERFVSAKSKPMKALQMVMVIEQRGRTKDDIHGFHMHIMVYRKQVGDGTRPADAAKRFKTFFSGIVGNGKHIFVRTPRDANHMKYLRDMLTYMLVEKKDDAKNALTKVDVLMRRKYKLQRYYTHNCTDAEIQAWLKMNIEEDDASSVRVEEVRCGAAQSAIMSDDSEILNELIVVDSENESTSGTTDGGGGGSGGEELIFGSENVSSQDIDEYKSVDNISVETDEIEEILNKLSESAN